jgi:succinoglycan biosynthesis transport protein ExoP
MGERVDLYHLARVLGRRWRLFTVVLIACLAGAALAAWTQTPIYRSSTVLVATTSEAGQSTSSALTTAQQATTLSQFATTEPVQIAAATEAARSLGVPPRLPSAVEASASGNSAFLTVSVSDADPRWAQAVANAYLTALPEALQPIDPTVAAAAEQLAVVTAAGLPTVPASPNRTLYLSLGLVLGAVLAVGLVVLREALDRQVHDPRELQRSLRIPVAGVIPFRNPKEHLPVTTSPTSPRGEAYRAVQAYLTHSDVKGLPRLLVVTSASPGAGATTLAANLAVAMAGGGRRVLLVDANLRAPRLHQLFGVPIEPGFVDVLAGDRTAAEAAPALQGGSLRVLVAGRAHAGSVEQLTGQRMRDLLTDLREGFDVVVLDTGSVRHVADTLFLAADADAVLLVGRDSATTKDHLQQAADALRHVRAPLVGIVLNARTGRRGQGHPPAPAPAATPIDEPTGGG